MPKIRTGFEYSYLNQLAAQVDDLEGARIAVGNRRARLVRPKDQKDEDGICRGLGMTLEDNPDILGPIDLVATGLADLEVHAIRAIEKYMRYSPWGPWLKSDTSRGVGEKQLARLLGACGDPYWHNAENRPRRVGELWAYCGMHVVQGESPKRRKGAQSNWSDDARKRAWLIAGSCVKTTGRYRDVYDAAKLRYAESVHDRECVRCGPRGRPALPGSPISDGHRHARALRAVAKTVLKDLWIEARRLHGVTGNSDGLALQG